MTRGLFVVAYTRISTGVLGNWACANGSPPPPPSHFATLYLPLIDASSHPITSQLEHFTNSRVVLSTANFFFSPFKPNLVYFIYFFGVSPRCLCGVPYALIINFKNNVVLFLLLFFLIWEGCKGGILKKCFLDGQNFRWSFARRCGTLGGKWMKS